MLFNTLLVRAFGCWLGPRAFGGGLIAEFYLVDIWMNMSRRSEEKDEDRKTEQKGGDEGRK